MAACQRARVMKHNRGRPIEPTLICLPWAILSLPGAPARGEYITTSDEPLVSGTRNASDLEAKRVFVKVGIQQGRHTVHRFYLRPRRPRVPVANSRAQSLSRTPLTSRNLE